MTQCRAEPNTTDPVLDYTPDLLQSNTQTQTHIDRQRDRQTPRYMYRQTDRHRDTYSYQTKHKHICDVHALF